MVWCVKVLGCRRIHAHGREYARRQEAGRPVYGGTINRSGSLRLARARWRRHHALQQMIELVRQAQGSRAPVARLADVVSGYFTVGVTGVAFVTFRSGWRSRRFPSHW